jgi:hypothetical protein
MILPAGPILELTHFAQLISKYHVEQAETRVAIDECSRKLEESKKRLAEEITGPLRESELKMDTRELRPKWRTLIVLKKDCSLEEEKLRSLLGRTERAMEKIIERVNFAGPEPEKALLAVKIVVKEMSRHLHVTEMHNECKILLSEIDSYHAQVKEASEFASARTFERMQGTLLILNYLFVIGVLAQMSTLLIMLLSPSLNRQGIKVVVSMFLVVGASFFAWVLREHWKRSKN